MFHERCITMSTDVDHLRACYDNARRPHKPSGIDGVTKAGVWEESWSRTCSGPERTDLRTDGLPSHSRNGARYIPKPGSAKGRPLGHQLFRRQAGGTGGQARAWNRSTKRMFEAQRATGIGRRSKSSMTVWTNWDGPFSSTRCQLRGRSGHSKSFFDKVHHEWLLTVLAPPDRRPPHRAGWFASVCSRAGIHGRRSDPMQARKAPRRARSCRRCCRTCTLHYVLDLWFTHRVHRPHAVRRGVLLPLRRRLCGMLPVPSETPRRFGSAASEGRSRRSSGWKSLALEKTRCIAFGRYARQNGLGAGDSQARGVHVSRVHPLLWEDPYTGYFKVKRRTSRKKFQAKASGRSAEWVRGHPPHDSAPARLFRIGLKASYRRAS